LSDKGDSTIRLRSSQLPLAYIVRYRIDDSRVVSNHTVYGDPEKAAVYTFNFESFQATRRRALFGAGLGGPDYPQPTAIFAADPTGAGGDDPSQRPFETVIPLGARLDLTPNSTFALGQESALATAITGLAGVVLVAWEHKAIVKSLLPAITNQQVLPGLPTKWDGTRFDVVLRFDRESPQGSWSFRQLFPCLLSGDSNTPLD
jgi:hypothetical protein